MTRSIRPAATTAARLAVASGAVSLLVAAVSPPVLAATSGHAHDSLAAGGPQATAAGAAGRSVGTADDDTRRRPLDGFLVETLPAGVGPLVTDFAYEWEEVSHRSRVWESGPDHEGAYRVDMSIAVLRGESLIDRESLRSYLADYYELDPADWELTPFDPHGHPGYRDHAVAFWLQSPGVAIVVKLDGNRFSAGDLLRTANSIRPARTG
ncbi:hypothetical protein [Actinopolymorpha pittospori]